MRIPPETLAAAPAGTARPPRRSPSTAGSRGEAVRVRVRPWSRPGPRAVRATWSPPRPAARPTRTGPAWSCCSCVAGFVTFVAAAVAVWVATGRALRPLRQMATPRRRGRAVAGPDPPAAAARPHRTPSAGWRRSFNAMMDRLAGGVRSARDGAGRAAAVHRRRLARAADAADHDPQQRRVPARSTREARDGDRRRGAARHRGRVACG